MILAAGRGSRMGALTEQTPKPLLRIHQHYLIEYSIDRLRQAGIKDIVINVSYHADQIKSALGNGQAWGVNIIYSEEPSRLETGGGILQALPLLGEAPFVVVSCDIVSDYPIQQLPQAPQGLAHLVMVNNPIYHPNGDFGLIENRLDLEAKPTLTMGNISVIRPELFADAKPGYFRLATLLIPAIRKGLLTGEYYQGKWHNIGAPEDLANVAQCV